MKVLLFHIPQSGREFGPFGRSIFVTQMALGLPALANFARSRGHETTIINAALETFAQGEFRLQRYTEEFRPDLAGFSLHWHHQVPSTLQAIHEMRRLCPNTPILVGGLTASAFPADLLRLAPEIDFIIQGDGEKPLVALLDSLQTANGFSLETVPNLWRRGPDGLPVPPAHHWCARPEFIHTLDYVPGPQSLLNSHLMPLLPRWLPMPRLTGAMRTLLRRALISRPPFTLPMARGCTQTCPWCGSKPQWTGVGREAVNFLYPHVLRASSAGYSPIAVDAGGPGVADALAQLWARLRNDSQRLKWRVATFPPPSNEFLLEYSASATTGSEIELAVDIESETARHCHKGYTFTNAEVFRVVDQCQKLGLIPVVFLLDAYPWPALTSDPLYAREKRDFLQTLDRLAQTGQLRVHYNPYEPDPGSPAAVAPESFGLSAPPMTRLDDWLEPATGYPCPAPENSLIPPALTSERCSSPSCPMRSLGGRATCAASALTHRFLL